MMSHSFTDEYLTPKKLLTIIKNQFDFNVYILFSLVKLKKYAE